MTNTDKTLSTERLTNLFGTWLAAHGTPNQIESYNDFYAREIAPAIASRTQEPAEWQVAIATAIFDPGAFVGMKGERTLTEWQVDAVMTALRAASITSPAPERSKEEVGKLADARKRMQEKLDYFDAEVAEELANENERADLWTDIEVLVDDLRTLLSALEPASPHKGEDQDGACIGCGKVAHDCECVSQDAPAPLPVGDEEALLALIREEAGKDNSPLGRSDSLAIRRIRTALGLDPHSGAALSKPGEQ